MFCSHSWKQKFLRVMAPSLLPLLLGAACFGQQPTPGSPDGPPPGPGRHGHHEMGGPGGHGGPGGPGGPMRLGPPGRWWDDPDYIKKLALSDDQQKKMDDIFNSNRLKLIDQFAALQKEEAIMEPLVSADPPDEPKLLAQIDRVAQARAELEKANARMLLGLRRQLTHEQFLKLKAERPPMHGPMHGHGPEDGPPPDRP